MESPPPSLSIGQWIRKARLAGKLSYKDLAKVTYVSEGFIKRLEEDAYDKLPAKVYSLSLANDLLEILKCPIEEKSGLMKFFEDELNLVELEKYNLLKTQNYTSRISKFSMEEEPYLKTAEQRKAKLDAARAHSSETSPRPPLPLPAETAPSSVFAAKKAAASAAKNIQTNKASSTSTLANTTDVSAHATTSASASTAEPSEEDVYIEKLEATSAALSNLRKWFVFLLIMTLVFAVLGGWYFFIRPATLAAEPSDSPTLTQNSEVFSLYGRSQTFELGEGDQLRIFLANAIAVLTLKSITDDVITFHSPDGQVHTTLLHERDILDLYTGNEVGDLLIKYQKRSGDLAVIFVENLLYNELQVDYDSIWRGQEHISVGREYTLLSNHTKIPITVYVKAVTLPIHLSYNIDGRRQNTLNLAVGTSVVINADEHMELQIGNYLSSAVIINKIPVNLTLEDYNRYSTTKIIKWLASYDNETVHDLVITDYLN